jgi:uncharacterized repeat protein (TIGR01451 family)
VAVADLGVTKTDGQTTAVPGQPVTYTIGVANAGPDDAAGATVTDTVPAALQGVTWTSRRDRPAPRAAQEASTTPSTCS